MRVSIFQLRAIAAATLVCGCGWVADGYGQVAAGGTSGAGASAAGGTVSGAGAASGAGGQAGAAVGTGNAGVGTPGAAAVPQVPVSGAAGGSTFPGSVPGVVAPDTTPPASQLPGNRTGQQPTAPGVRAGQQSELPGNRTGRQTTLPGNRTGQISTLPGDQTDQPSTLPGNGTGQQSELPGARVGQQPNAPGVRAGQKSELPGVRVGQQATAATQPADVTQTLSQGLSFQPAQGTIPGSGLRVSNLGPNTWASTAGLQNNDQIISINGQTLSDSTQVFNQLQTSIQNNVAANIVVNRNGQQVPITVNPAQFGLNLPAAGPINRTTGFRGLGDALISTPDGIRVSNVGPNSWTQAAGLQQNDQIISLNGQTLNDSTQIINQIQNNIQNNTTMNFIVNRNGRQVTLAVPASQLQGVISGLEVGVNPGIGAAFDGNEVNALDTTTDVQGATSRLNAGLSSGTGTAAGGNAANAQRVTNGLGAGPSPATGAALGGNAANVGPSRQSLPSDLGTTTRQISGPIQERLNQIGQRIDTLRTQVDPSARQSQPDFAQLRSDLNQIRSDLNIVAQSAPAAARDQLQALHDRLKELSPAINQVSPGQLNNSNLNPPGLSTPPQ